MVIAILFILLVILFLSRMKWRISTLSLIYYMKKKRYTLPDEKELKECTEFVVANSIKDLVGYRSKK